MIVEIDHKSGFCFGVQNAIGIAENKLKTEGLLYSLGHIVHNEKEVERLKNLGLETISHEKYFRLKNCKVLIRAHGEPPATYKYARENNIELIDATCPVVLMLQKRVRKAADAMLEKNGQIVIFGHKEHAEVKGLLGQTDDKAIVIENPDDLKSIDPDRPAVVFSQTTKSVEQFNSLKQNLEKQSVSGSVETHDTICRQVSNRIPHLHEFATRYAVVIFVGGQKSSNAQVLFDVCKKQNKRSYFISSPEELMKAWFLGAESVGICGATSTPHWLMEQVAQTIKTF